MAAKPDFSGYATKANLRCSDGRTITPDAFAHQDKTRVPLVWQHTHNEPTNVLGHAILEKRDDGVYAYGYFNSTAKAQDTKILVKHGDITAMSIYANGLVEKNKVVQHGKIREVSLVLAGANPGAVIDNINIEHSDGTVDELADEAVISLMIPLEHSGLDEVEEETRVETPEVVEHADDGETVRDVVNSMNDKQKNVLMYLIGQAVKNKAGAPVEHSDDSDEEFTKEEINEVFHSMTETQQNASYFVIQKAIDDLEVSHADETENSADADTDTTAAHAENQEGNIQMSNLFENNEGSGATGTATKTSGYTLSHADKATIFANAKMYGSLRKAVEQFQATELKHGIDNIEILFPDAKNVNGTPEWIKRQTEWVAGVISGTRHVPFSKIKSMTADITMEEARAKGFIKGNLKKEEFFSVAKRETGPQTIYKKQKLDRDDIIDISDFDIVAWLKGEMRIMLEEEIARAILIGDGRSAEDEDKIREDRIRPIATDHDLYVTRLWLNLSGDTSYETFIDKMIRNRRHYKGTGNPVMFMGETLLSELLLIRNLQGDRIYKTTADLEVALRVSRIVTVELMDDDNSDVLAIAVNLSDYTVGTNAGGQISLFDDFDIDYNQQKYLIETRLSGALTKVKAALVFLRAGDSSVLVDPVAPTFNPTNHSVTVANTTGVTYKNQQTDATLTSGTPYVLSDGEELTVVAEPNSGYYFSDSTNDQFRFDYDRGRVGGAF